jgi:hypothetical protein
MKELKEKRKLKQLLKIFLISYVSDFGLEIRKTIFVTTILIFFVKNRNG